jgi:glycosyltransferase 2 family protein
VKRALKLLASIAVTVVFTWWAFRDTDWKGQWASLKAANYLWLLPYFGILTGIHLFRTFRWGALLSGLERVPFRKLNEASAIGFMMLLILPFRLGEFARPFLIAQRSSIRRSAAMTSVVLERIVDGITIALLLRVLLFFVPDAPPRVLLGANLMFAVFAGGLGFLLFAYWQKARAVAFVRAVAGVVSPRLADNCADVVDRFVGALEQRPSAPQMALFFAFTGFYWALNGYGMAVLSRAFDCTGDVPGCVPLPLSSFQGYVVLCVLVVGLMIPAAPGSMGTFQAFVKTGLAIFLPAATVNTSGMAFANVLWLLQVAQQIFFGILFLSAGHLSFKDIASKLSDGDSLEARG